MAGEGGRNQSSDLLDHPARLPHELVALHRHLVRVQPMPAPDSARAGTDSADITYAPLDSNDSTDRHQ